MAALELAAPVRPQDHRRAGHRGPRVRMLRAGQRPTRGRRALRDPAFARILRLRRQVSSQPGATVVLPADLTPEQTAEIQRLAVECYRAVGCEGMARVDFLMEAKTGAILHQRDQYHPRIHLHQHVPENVGSERTGLSQADRPPDRAGAGAPQGSPGHPLQPIHEIGNAAPARPDFSSILRRRGARTRACRVETRLDTVVGRQQCDGTQRRQECRRGTHECVRHIVIQARDFDCVVGGNPARTEARSGREHRATVEDDDRRLRGGGAGSRRSCQSGRGVFRRRHSVHAAHAGSALQLLRSGPIPAASGNGAERAEGLRQHRQRASGARHRIADLAGNAGGQGGSFGRRRDRGGQRHPAGAAGSGAVDPGAQPIAAA